MRDLLRLSEALGVLAQGRRRLFPGRDIAHEALGIFRLAVRLLIA